MGELKESVRKAVSRKNVLNETQTQAYRICKKHEEANRKRIGSTVIWRTRHNNELKEPQLVQVIEVYPRHVVLEKMAYSIDGFERCVRFSVSYYSMHCGLDTFTDITEFKI